jgi:hypothetical protein
MMINKRITQDYIDFSVEASHMFDYRGSAHKDPKRRTWSAIVENYKTLKIYERKFFDFKGLKVEVNKLYVGAILNLRHTEYITQGTSLRYDGYFLVTAIDDQEVILDEYRSMAPAGRAQRQINKP